MFLWGTLFLETNPAKRVSDALGAAAMFRTGTPFPEHCGGSERSGELVPRGGEAVTVRWACEPYGIARKAISPARRKAWVRAAARQPEASSSHGVPVIDISTLNPAQLEAVTAPDGPVLVIAGAGSGKTRTIVHRLAWLAEQGVPASDMLLLTFTRKASREMLLRATDLLGYSIGGVHGGTFHSFAFSVLRQYRPAWAEGPVTVMDSADSASAIQQCKERLKVGKGDRSFPKTQTIIGLLSKARNKEISIGDVLQRDAQHLLPHADALESIGKAYRGYRRQHGLLDYDDLLFELEDLLKGDPEAGREGLAERFRERYRYIMVDEYQDTNRVQARLVRLLAGEAGNVMAVGDDAQSIYAFRGADVRNILDFPKLFPGTRVIRLEENYRSTQPVLDVANAVLAPASEGFRKNLFTTREDTPKTPRVRLVRPMSDLTQANVVAARVEELLDCHQAKEIAVLFRAGYQSYHLEVALSKRGIKFHKYGGLRYAEAVHVKDVVAFVRLAINPLDMPSFERVAGLSKGVGIKTAEKIYHVAAQGDFDALRKACTKYPDLWSDMLLLDKLREHNLTPAALIEMVIEHYTPRLQAIFPDDWPRRQQGLSELAHIASAYTDLEQFVADLSLETPEDDTDEFDEAGRVVLSTIHSSKGLEWDAVILLDLVEDRFPSRHALVRPEDFEEERRLMYVACTRAREDLELFVPATLYSRQNGGNEPATPSPFVRELPFSALEEWQEGYTGRISKRSTSFAGDPAFSRRSLDIPRELANPNAGRVKGVFPPPGIPEAKDDRVASKGGAGCGYCRHKVFGRGKIVEQLPPDKCRVNFPGFGLKVILSTFLTLEE